MKKQARLLLYTLLEGGSLTDALEATFGVVLHVVLEDNLANIRD
jgi:hypothetical protein